MSLEAGESCHDARAMQLAHELLLHLRSIEQDIESERDCVPINHKHFDDKTLALHSLDVVLCDAVQTVRKLRNRANTALRVPPELWAAIFSMVPAPTWPPSSGAEAFGRSSCLINVSHVVPLTAVCRSWRQIALSTSSLWSTILDTGDPGRPVFWSHYAHRCTAGPLFFGILQTPAVETIALLQKERSRVRELYYRYHDLPMRLCKSRLAKLCSSQLPNLIFCTLDLSCLVLDAGHRYRVSLPGHSLLGLTISGAHISPTMNLAALTTLTLCKICCMFPDELLDILTRTLRLQRLLLANIQLMVDPAAGYKPAEGSSASRPIALPFLRFIAASKAPCASRRDAAHYFHKFLRRVLSQMTYPPTCRMILNSVHMDDFLPLINVILRNKLTHPGVSVYLPMDASREELFFSVSSAGERWRKCRADITTHDIGNPTELQQLVGTLIASPHLMNLRSLSTHSSWLCKLLSNGVSFEHVTNLVIRKPPSGTEHPITTQDVVKILKPQGGAGNTPLPALIRLSVHCCLPDDLDSPHWDSARLQDTGEILMVRNLGKLRSKAGHPLAFLHVVASGPQVTEVLEYYEPTLDQLHRREVLQHAKVATELQNVWDRFMRSPLTDEEG
ncbi:hypothetical protein ONZ51_g12613 [Trametes cubensis]|uniref:F-box domain-containing protein n=1 Tax=Trametes cubensis TaxID=1111947 RepID=A0AAD7X6Q8_9APHY|nr:hypothetical protein ONZ51_g12613 [Trametes cubensis]